VPTDQAGRHDSVANKISGLERRKIPQIFPEMPSSEKRLKKDEQVHEFKALAA
jgi:hypothetical protein